MIVPLYYKRVFQQGFGTAGWMRRIVFSSSGDQTREGGFLRRGRLLPNVLSAAMNGIAESLFTTLFPSDCRICGAPLTNISRLPVCLECLSAVRPLAGTACAVCGERMVSPYVVTGESSEARCGLCRRVSPPYARAMAYGSYDGGLRELIHLLKYERVRPAAKVLGRMLAEVIAHFEPLFGAAPVLLVPVPLHSTKIRQREFNQSEMIARAALKVRFGDDRLRLSGKLLVRRRATASQIGLSSHQRRENLRGAFAVIDPEEVKGREVLLVDDVFTTGTTVSECARVLRRAGASKVWVATVARTLKLDAQQAKPEFGRGVKEAAEMMKMAAAG